ncbi:hypothetical protein [Desulfomonile tiedjei]|uniref:Uncharacterized protein n=1 Tax=Desulfomonile tiedjei (strain ATCC 49306 / DSM 6799 / DCB-1) TaxID=706587 RepID=I4C5Z2_DESTA|nr:hypothetical protein [Desulfomonile tiedjei]AFM24983.1 hypothetical protein Desti_2295 [Desulfomonile tiedjei DSM 6799]
MESILAYTRDRHELRCALLDKGFHKALAACDAMEPAILEQVIGTCFSLQYHRCTQKTAKAPCLWQKIRSELGLSQAELAAEVSKFHRLDVSKQTVEWRSERERFAASMLRPSDFKMWKMNNLNVRSLEQWERDHPQPNIRNIGADDIQLIERTRPHRESRKSGFVEVFERFFTDRCGVKLSWEDLMCEITGNRDPRKHRLPETEKKRNKEKRAANDALDSPLSPSVDGTEQALVADVA